MDEDENWAAASRRDYLNRHPEPYVDTSEWACDKFKDKPAPKSKPDKNK